jgi:HAD superfamily phosphatase (TIGR01668 family)
MILKMLYPYDYVEDIYSISYEKLYKKGYRALIFDIDNTLVHHGDSSNPKIDKFFKDIQKIGFKTLLLSDNSKERIEEFIKNIDTLYINSAHKPNKEGFLKAINLLNIEKEKIIVIGDQVFNDILGANKCGIPNILVQYLRYDNEKKIGKKRTLEKIILKFYLKSNKYQKRFGDILKEK